MDGWMDGDDRSLNGVAYCYVKGLPYMTSAVGGEGGCPQIAEERNTIS